MVEFVKLLINLYFIIFFISLFSIIILPLNLIIVLIALELLVFNLSYLFLLYSFLYDSLGVQMYILSLLVISACEAAIGLALFINYYRLNGTLDVDYIEEIKG